MYIRAHNSNKNENIFFQFFSLSLFLLSSFDDDDYYDVKLSEKKRRKEKKINLELQLSLIIDLL